jgi:hypothetical protein
LQCLETPWNCNIIYAWQSQTSPKKKSEKKTVTVTPLHRTENHPQCLKNNSQILQINPEKPKNQSFSFIPSRNENEEKSTTQIKLKQESATQMIKTREKQQLGKEIRRKINPTNRRSAKKKSILRNPNIRNRSIWFTKPKTQFIKLKKIE